MKEKRLYTCEICHTDYAQKEDALKCEKEHCEKFDVKDFRINPHQKYPHKFPFYIFFQYSQSVRFWYQ